MKKKCFKSITHGMIILFLFVSLWSCATTPVELFEDDKKVALPPAEKPVNEPKNIPVVNKTQTAVSYYIHTVKWPGETVSIISGWYTGDIKNWETLAEANSDIDPKVVVVGQKIRIPENMLTNKNPMTKVYVDSFYPKPVTRKPKPRPSVKKDEAPALYGPK